MDESRRKSIRMRNLAYSGLLFVAIAAVAWYRGCTGTTTESAEVQLKAVSGQTMGTTYAITYVPIGDKQLAKGVDSLLAEFNQCLSTYIPDSEISTFNRRDTMSLAFGCPWFLPVLKKSAEVHAASQGAFDPTIMPLVLAYGFGPEQKKNPSPREIDSLLRFVGMGKLHFDDTGVFKDTLGVKLDFSALAKGYAVDLVAEHLLQQGVRSFMVEIGGEVRCAGVKPTGDTWTIGIEKPVEDEQALMVAVRLRDRSMATSGNYRNYYVTEDGEKYSHTLSPTTGQVVRSELLSATVVAPDCMTADAYATAFMVMGREKTLAFLQEHPELDAYLIFGAGEGFSTYATAGVEDMLLDRSGQP